MTHQIRLLKERLVYANKFVKLYDDDVLFPDGKAGRYVRLRAVTEGHAAVLIPIYRGKIALVQVFRYALGQLVWEFPRGFSQGKSVEDTARGELQEELGIKVATIETLGFIAPDSGIQSARVAVVIARVGDPGDGPQDTTEVASARWVTPTELEEMMKSGEIEDGFTLAAYSLLRLNWPQSEYLGGLSD
jgi:8-oxo-dGTP pyrophosphatase MutT (NUDIX family)